MATDEAKQAYLRRLPLIEPLFAILKNQLGAQQFTLRGLTNVKAEWSLLATAFNLRTALADMACQDCGLLGFHVRASKRRTLHLTLWGSITPVTHLPLVKS